jgi:hypothetical protein
MRFMFNVLFASGRVMEFGTIEIATIYATAYNGSILPQIVLDNVNEPGYNDCVVNDMEIE